MELIQEFKNFYFVSPRFKETGIRRKLKLAFRCMQLQIGKNLKFITSRLSHNIKVQVHRFVKQHQMGKLGATVVWKCYVALVTYRCFHIRVVLIPKRIKSHYDKGLSFRHKTLDSGFRILAFWDWRFGVFAKKFTSIRQKFYQLSAYER